MTSKQLGSCALTILMTLMPLTSRADLYTAAAASERKEFERAFELYRELAELGQPEAQENLAAMYVNGEGVKRDNVLGYAWAAIAKEGGGGDAAASIIAQLEPHLNAAARSRVAEVRARFGKAALQERLLPKPYDPAAKSKGACSMRRATNPDASYPREAKRQGIPGSVIVDVTVAPDGSARNVRVWNSFPVGTFDEVGRRVAFSSVYTPPIENGVAVPCRIRFKVKFGINDEVSNGLRGGQHKLVREARARAEEGDPRSQLSYGLALEMGQRPIDKNNLPIEWYVKAAQGGIPAARYLVGRHLLAAADGGLEPDHSKGIAWLQMAADVGQPDAQTLLANYLLRKDPEHASGKAQDLLEKAAASGHRDGKFYLAGVLATGPDAARRDPRRALDLLEQVRGELDFDPAFFEVRAAAHAMLGDFTEAQNDQKKALLKATNFGWDTKDQKARLENYTASKPWTGNLLVL
jgi:TonB family protein